MVTAVRVKQKWDNRHKRHLLSVPRTAILTDNTNEMIRTLVSNRKKGKIFVNKDGETFTDLALVQNANPSLCNPFGHPEDKKTLC